MKNALFLIFSVVSILISESAAAKIEMSRQGGAITVKQATTAEIEELFLQNDFEDFHKPRGEYPRIYMQHLPKDWQNIPENDAKHRTFIRILLPLVLKINEEIAAERDNIEQIRKKYVSNGYLEANDIKLLEEKAQKYDVFTHLKGDSRIRSLIRQTLTNIDEVPPSIMIATAAIYTNWGNSRLAREANSLYLDEIWYEKKGLVPLDDPDGGYRYQIYDTLEDCIRARALLINSHINYDYLRHSRMLSRNMKRPPYGEQLAVKMLSDSNLPNIAGLIDYTFTFYKLNRTDFFPKLRDVKNDLQKEKSKER